MRRKVYLAIASVAISLLLPSPVSAGGAVYLDGHDQDDVQHCDESSCGQAMGHILSQLYHACGDLPAGEGILAIGANRDTALTALVGGFEPFQGVERLGWNHPDNGGPNAPVTHCNTLSCIGTVDFNDYRVLYVASSRVETFGGLTQPQLDALIARQADIADWVNNRNGRIFAITEFRLTGQFGWLPSPVISINSQGVLTNRISDGAGGTNIENEFPGNGATDLNMDGVPYHNLFIGPAGWSGLDLLLECEEHTINDPDHPGSLRQGVNAVGGCGVKLTAELCDDGFDNDGDALADADDCDCWVCGDGEIDPTDADGDCAADGVEPCDDGNNLAGDGCSADCERECPESPSPDTQGYWHRQCLGTGEILTGSSGRGPVGTIEPGFVRSLQPCADARLLALGFAGTNTCEGLDADPPQNACERALKQLTAVILNVCSGRLGNGCAVDLASEGCSSTTVGGLVGEAASLILGGDCKRASDCAAAVNEGDALAPGPAGGSPAVPTFTAPSPDPPEPSGVERRRDEMSLPTAFHRNGFGGLGARLLEEEGIRLVRVEGVGRSGKSYMVPVAFFVRHDLPIFEGADYYQLDQLRLPQRSGQPARRLSEEIRSAAIAVRLGSGGHGKKVDLVPSESILETGAAPRATRYFVVPETYRVDTPATK